MDGNGNIMVIPNIQHWNGWSRCGPSLRPWPPDSLFSAQSW